MTAMPSLLFGAIADDLTGGTELASMLVARGIPTGCTVGLDAPIPSGNLAHVILLKTRVIAASDAVHQVREAADRLVEAGARQIFFKYCATFDSTPTGNIGPCAEALLERLGGGVTLFTPALCETGRTVYQGHMFGGAQLLGESPKRFDPLTPMTDSNLVRVLQAQSKGKVGLVPYLVVDAGAGAIRSAIQEQSARGETLLVTDTIRERDLAAIAEATFDLPLMTGNSSVAAHLPTAWVAHNLVNSDDLVVASLPAVEGPAAVLAGSVADRTIEQLERLAENNPLLTIDLARAFAGADVMAEARAFAQRHLPGAMIAIATTAPQATVETLQQAHGREAVAAKAEEILARIAEILVRQLGVRRLVVAGGETAGSVVKALGIDRIAMGAYEGPGLSRAIAHLPGLPADPLALMLKSGKLGGPDIFTDVLQDMTRPSAIAPAIDTWPPARRAS
ncbi:four-carbon acid sugar kinase family protein [Mesorhizobium sp. M7D.F.Ca.US.005.01.1.1]|uniref:3-oxo-tetronate kinase n=1 Tax=Mesorhizobium sp. M7D.F.Ca.US.005.01.1.1 TaxID=2493678 RepID=UPI000F750591|nr:3-oxo-tetronate kinase [Mesorhizobium sp. M7D.F.Ca.US.005.01.1.1]AZO40944.1 four-carbon acid sugar kinase family protein [Mesorhizobium sp. M7D.F.Ca.US.005.01.1.1]